MKLVDLSFDLKKIRTSLSDENSDVCKTKILSLTQRCLKWQTTYLQSMPVDFLLRRTVKTGIYESTCDFNWFVNTFSDSHRLLMPESLFGVADNPNQIIKYGNEKLSNAEYVVDYFIVKKEDQDPHNGWRWHKWGAYIGNKTQRFEYLYDEPDITKVLCFCFHETESIPQKGKNNASMHVVSGSILR